jgi:hypothetical protein
VVYLGLGIKAALQMPLSRGVSSSRNLSASIDLTALNLHFFDADKSEASKNQTVCFGLKIKAALQMSLNQEGGVY